MSILIPKISEADIDQLREPGLTHAKSEILCRMGIFSYFRSEDDIWGALGDGWNAGEIWLDESIENQGFAVWNDDVAIISFRGSKSTGDWLQNFRAIFPERHPLAGRRHNGFHDVWLQKSDKVLAIINEKISENSLLWLTGHSLGGAITVQLASELIMNPSARVKDYFVMTFGAPRYGNKQFQRAYDNHMMQRHWFYANQRDPVPHLPPNVMGYRHAGTLKYFSHEGEHLPITKQEIGLHGASSVSHHWFALDEEIGSYSQSEQEKMIIDMIQHTASKEEIILADDGIRIDDTAGELQGDSLWLPSAHDKELYWKRIKALT